MNARQGPGSFAQKVSMFFRITPFAVAGLCSVACATDGTWNQAGGGGTYFWADSTNWVGGIVADGTNAFAHFDAVDAVSWQFIDLGGGSHTVGHMKFTDPTPSGGFWGLKNGTLNLATSSGLPMIEVSDAIRDVGIETSVTLAGDFQKTGAGQLFLKNLAPVSVDIAAGEVVYQSNANGLLFTTQSISGAGDLRFMGQAAGYFSFRPTYAGTLSLTGKTIVNLTPGSANWYQGALFLEKNDVLSHASVLEIQSGKVYMRAQTTTGLTVAGLKGNAGTYVTTDQSGIQKLTVDVATNQSHTYYGVIGADGTTAGKNNVSFTKTGAGTQVLSGTNTYAGGTTVMAGTLVGNADFALGSGSVMVTNGATLVLANGISNNYLDDSANLVLGASSTLELNFTGVADTIGTLSLNGGSTTVAPGTYTAAMLGTLGGGIYTGTGSLTVTAGGESKYDSWANSWGVEIGASTNDYDQDGLSNIYEYGLGGDPTNSAYQGISPVFGLVDIGGTNWFEYVHPQLHDPDSGVSYYLEIADNLLVPAWTNTGYEVTGTNVTGNSLDFVTNVTTTVAGMKFIRLIIE
ncbi:MAG: autotransporter-associated beta strand repeat-containing protein [Kiritimatiellales bacterium]|nr:autotransporter-associated beta strand repeat-containing protein [Kiritimatiellales bacterium]